MLSGHRTSECSLVCPGGLLWCACVSINREMLWGIAGGWEIAEQTQMGRAVKFAGWRRDVSLWQFVLGCPWSNGLWPTLSHSSEIPVHLWFMERTSRRSALCMRVRKRFTTQPVRLTLDAPSHVLVLSPPSCGSGGGGVGASALVYKPAAAQVLI